MYRFGDFELAISKTTQPNVFPVGSSPYRVDEPKAYGLFREPGGPLHPIEARVRIDGLATPLLPVEVIFTRKERETFGYGYLDSYEDERDLDHEERESATPKGKTYILRILFSDPDGSVFSSINRAMERSVESGYRFMILHCRSNCDPVQISDDDWRAMHEADKKLLLSVDRNEGKLGNFTFDRIEFSDQLATTAPAWSWQWNESEIGTPTFQHGFGAPAFQDHATAKWRHAKMKRL